MSIEIFTSRSIELLASGLAASLVSDPGQASDLRPDLFQPARIVVPSAMMKKWLQMQISRENSVAVNLDIRFFEEGLWNCIAALEAHAERGMTARLRKEPMSREVLQYLLVGCLLGAEPETPELAMLIRYVSDKEEINVQDQAQARKLWHISNELARLFREYEYHRPELILDWLNGKGTSSNVIAEAKDPDRKKEQNRLCQAFLYRAVFSKDGLLARLEAETGRQFPTLPRYCASVFDKLDKKDMSGWVRQSVNLFAISQFSTFHIDLLARLSPYFSWKIWHRETIPGCRQDGSRPLGALNELASRWGQRGLDNHEFLERLISECDGRLQVCDADETSKGGVEKKAIRPGNEPGTGADTTLHAVQRSLCGGFSPHAPRNPCRQDLSLQIAGCPGIYREVETVYNSIIHNQQEDASLKLTDIAVFVTDMDLYKPAVESVFGREPGCLEYNLVDSSALEDSVFAQAVLGLLELAEGAFSRRAVFELVLNPCFLSAAGVDRDEAMKWIEWAQRLNIFRGFDLQDKYRDSEAPAGGGNPLYTWQQGLQRLRLGRIMEVGEAGNGAQAFSHFHGVVPWSAMEVDDEGVEKFSLVIERLFETIRRIRKGPRPGAEWSRDLLGAADRFLAIPYGRKEEAFVRDRFRRCLQFVEGDSSPSGVQMLDRIVSLGGRRGRKDARKPQRISLPLVRELLRDTLGGIESRKGRLLGDGVTISTLKPDRALPFRIVYILGLGEGKFPGRKSLFALDLRRDGPRQMGDVDRPDLNRFAFLETVLSIRQKLYLTWANLDLQKDQHFFPCSLVGELVHGIERDLLPANEEVEEKGPVAAGQVQGKFLYVDIPLKGSSPRLVVVSANDPPPEVTDLLARSYSAMDCLICYNELMEAGQLKASEGRANQIEEALRRARPEFEAREPAGPDSQVEIEFVTLAELARFLENPVDASLRRHLRIYDDREEDFSIPEDEPFGTSFPFDYQLMTEVTGRLIETGVGLDEKSLRQEALKHLSGCYETHRMLGDTPDGAFGDLDENRYLEKLQGILYAAGGETEGLVKFLGSRPRESMKRNVMIGETGSGAHSDLQFPPLSLEAEIPGGAAAGTRRLAVTLQGEIPYLFEEAGEGVPEILVLAPTSKNEKDRTPTKHMLRGFLFYQASLASPHLRPVFEKRGVRVSVLYREGVLSWKYPPASMQEATTYLRTLVEDFLSSDDFDLLPLVIVKDVVMKVNGEERTPVGDDSDEAVSEELSAAYLEAVQDKLDEDQAGHFPKFRPAGLNELVVPRVPKDAYIKARRRLGPLFRYQK